ncbi:hypothetical protein BU14_0573s0006 [Porphyra umbilicalis]|uniref:NFACT RNA-binding domain-containing protein n=1 Tax=Porphyra umbilicalis TaxID=2786 RepID=A0A1X6NRU9_PORUM|nr:hypothetical protein BU14_0573s0006 [Porphyra umbilicalis]|eukprot:OSX71250.1 hypothetical protein BU14_0573s0006 [Porphyra umbilicalis]
MVFFYTPREDGYVIFVGRDKHENEELLKYGWNTDVWFHVDKLSSAHVYLRLPDGVTIDTIDAGVLEDCAQLGQHNSIEGNRTNGVIIVYTGWANLKKSGDMATGAGRLPRPQGRPPHAGRQADNAIVNRLNKTRRSAFRTLPRRRSRTSGVGARGAGGGAETGARGARPGREARAGKVAA